MRIVYGIICLCFLIFFHELGHFLAAKLFGVKVEAFSIGFGPKLFHKTIKGTDYRISCIPLGGYCAMKGEKEFANSLNAGLDYIEAEKDSLYGVNKFKRILIAFAGPFFNIILAFFAFTTIAVTGYTYYTYSNKILIPDEIQYPDLHSAAKEAGIMSGDVILSVDSNKINDFNDLITSIGTNPDKDLIIEVLRDGKTFTFNVHSDLDKKTGAGKIGILADTTTLEKKEAKRYWLIPAIWQGLKETSGSTLITIKGIFTLFKGVDIKENISGPARVADMMGGVLKESFSESIRSGVVNTLSFMAIISISLGVMNLLPVPVLDGGLILFALIELVSRRKLSPKVLYYIQFIGIGFILFMFLIGLNGDIHYFANVFKGIN